MEMQPFTFSTQSHEKFRRQMRMPCACMIMTMVRLLAMNFVINTYACNYIANHESIVNIDVSNFEITHNG
jgi:hypothetical protein